MNRKTLATLAAWRLRADIRAVRESDWAQRGTAAAFLLVGGAFMGGLFTLFLHGFRALLIGEPDFGPVVVTYVFELAFLAVLFLGVVSFVFSSLPLLFRPRDAELLGSFPVPVESYFGYRFLGALVLSSWPVIVVGIPAVLALGAVLRAGFAYHVTAAAVLALFVLASALLSALFSFAFAAVVRRIPAFVRHFLELAGFFLFAVWGARIFVSREVFALLRDADGSAAAASALDSVRELFVLTPSHHLVQPLMGLLPAPGTTHSEVMLRTVSIGPPSGSAAVIAVQLFGAATAIAASAVLLSVVVKRWYGPLLQAYRQGSFVAKEGDASVSGSLRPPFPRAFRWGHGFLFEKDLLMFFRSPSEVSKAGFFLVLLVLYVLGVRGVASLEDFTSGAPLALAVTLVFAATGYLALTFGMRFAFPSLSLEGRSAWVLWSSPVHAHEFFAWRFFFLAGLVTAVTTAVTWAVVALLALPAALAGYLLFAVPCVSVGVIAITLGHGSVFPDFSGHRGPESLTTTPAGLAATAIGIAYVAVLARYVHGFAYGYLVEGAIDPVDPFGMLIVTLTVVITYWALARRRLDSFEIA